MKKYNLYLLILVLTTTAIAFSIRSHVTINVSDSLPKGVYILNYIKDPDTIKKGDIVLFDTPENAKKYIYGRGYLNPNVKQLLKKVAATNKDHVMRINNKLYINRLSHSTFKEMDSLKRPLPYLSTKELQPREEELLVLGTNQNSFDSKYFGTIKRSDVKATAKLLFNF